MYGPRLHTVDTEEKACRGSLEVREEWFSLEALAHRSDPRGGCLLTGCYQGGPSTAPAEIGSEPAATPSREAPVPATRKAPTPDPTTPAPTTPTRSAATTAGSTGSAYMVKAGDVS